MSEGPFKGTVNPRTILSGRWLVVRLAVWFQSKRKAPCCGSMMRLPPSAISNAGGMERTEKGEEAAWVCPRCGEV